MADFDNDFGAFGDPNPPGTITALGMGPNDPLIDWGSNMRPSDLQQYIHDPEGFKQNMIKQGIAPPDHHYVQQPDGSLQAVNPATGAPVSRAMSNFGFQGEGRGDNNPPVPPQIRGPAAPASQALGFQPFPGGTSTEAPYTPPEQPPGQVYIPGKGMVARPLPPPAPAPAPAPAAAPSGESLNPPIPLPRPSPLRMTPSTTEGGIDQRGGGEVPASVPEEEKKVTEDAKKAQEEKKKKVDQDLSDFAKSLQGVKAPPRPQVPGIGTPGVRSPVGINPHIQDLLNLAGAARPNVVQQSLMKLLGRA